MMSLPQGSVDWNRDWLVETIKTEGRSRKGAWIEIRRVENAIAMDFCRSRKGAWIEINNINYTRVNL